MEKLFLILVELARILVAFFLWASPRRRTQHWLIQGNVLKSVGHLFEVWFSELTWCIFTVQNSVTANSSLLSDGWCKHYTSNTAKSYVKWLRWKQWLRYIQLWDAKGNKETCENNSKTIKQYARRFPRGRWSFLGPGSEKKWYATYNSRPNGCLDQTAEKMMQIFQRFGHPIFRCTSALVRGQLRSKRGGRTTRHFTASDDNDQSLLKMVISVNQLSLYGTVAYLIQELPDDQRAPGKLVASDQMEQEILTQPLVAEVQANEERRRNLWNWTLRYLEMRRKIVQKGGSKAMHDSALSRT